ncbi:hypothetical protein LR48_Vigan02g118100 [Vigna angularis]|uniref:Uncharacterized protein n=1 Tax=Phaseolus angularis TaxID=3914 RepID=A0A0L9TX10_PHAAN|nr:hypothetical protein LR48_Vigan02g118100 [Vigna angularis]
MNRGNRGYQNGFWNVGFRGCVLVAGQNELEHLVQRMSGSRSRYCLGSEEQPRQYNRSTSVLNELRHIMQDIYDLQEEENLDLEMSSPHNSGFEAAFKGNPKILNDSTSNGCDVNSNETKSKSNGWSDWGLGANKTGQANTKSNDGCEVTLKCAAHRVARLRSSANSLGLLHNHKLSFDEDAASIDLRQ